MGFSIRVVSKQLSLRAFLSMSKLVQVYRDCHGAGSCCARSLRCDAAKRHIVARRCDL